MFDFLGSSWSSLMDMLPKDLNPMNLIPDELNPFTVGQGLLEEGASLAPKISDYVRGQAAKQASGLPLPATTRFGTPIPEWARNPTPYGIFGQPDAQGNKIGLLSAMSGTRPALNQGIFAPNLPVGNISGIQGILGDIYPDSGILPTDPIFDATTLKATGEEEVPGTEDEETEDEKRERLERARTLVEGFNEIAKSQQYNQPQIKPPTASAGTSAPAIQLTPTDMRTIAQGNKGGGVFGILGG
tara:strand:- start:3634 stop:4362 length:729 start_codon:yes stop_codon:yes gene_type:complete